MKTNTYHKTYGSDPEFIVINRGGEPVSAIDVFKHGKDDKIDLKDGYSVYYDNVLGETNVPPGSTKEEVINNVRETIRRISDYLGRNYSMAFQASHTYKESDCKHPDAMLFGCSPEFDAYLLQTCVPPSCNHTFRSAGGHIHVGRSDFNNFADKEMGELMGSGEFLVDPYSKVKVIKMMDLVIGLPLAFMDNDPTSPARKRLYGNAGRHRVTPYGVEYRTPSNYWLRSPELTSFIYDASEFALEIVENEKFDSFYKKVDADLVVDIVNTNNKSKAAAMLKTLDLPKNFLTRIETLSKDSFESVAKNWGLI